MQRITQKDKKYLQFRTVLKEFPNEEGGGWLFQGGMRFEQDVRAGWNIPHESQGGYAIFYSNVEY